MRVGAMGAALGGGVCLVANLWVDLTALTWTGLALLGVAVVVVGASLVRRPWLAVVAAAGSVTLAASVLDVARSGAPDREVDAVVGGLATLCVAVAMLRGPAAPRPRPGNHRS